MGATLTAPPAGTSDALADLHRARRRRRVANLDLFEAVYQAYLTALGTGLAVLWLSGITGDDRLTRAEAVDVRLDGPAVVGLVVAAAVAVALRSGGRGGPLVLEAPEVRHVLLAPVDRNAALRPVALRQLRSAAFAGLVGGAVGGLLAFRRLPGNPIEWIAYGAVTGTLAASASVGTALVASGRRVHRRIADLLALLLLAWSVLDVVARDRSIPFPPSPFTLLGRLALWPLRFDALALVGVAVAIALAVAGWAWIGGLSLEAADRRASLVSQLRFAATLQDVRTVVVLRRQLSQELPRSRPWIRLPSWSTGTGTGVWRRDWQGVLRWPSSRVLRLLLLGAVAGASAAGSWSVATALVVVAGIALYVAALDATEPLGQEMDHPDRLLSAPRESGPVLARHLAQPVFAMLPAVGAGLVVAVLATEAGGGDPGLALRVGLVVLVPAAATAVAAAATATVIGPASPMSPTGQMLPPEVAGLRLVARMVWPPAVATVGVLPVLVARAATEQDLSPAGAAASVLPVVVLLVGLVVAWLVYREPARAWWSQQVDAAKSQRASGSRADEE